MIKRILAGFALAFVATAALAATACPQFFLGGEPPVVVAPVTSDLTDICFNGYGLEHSGAWREPVWSAEHLIGVNVPPAGTVRNDKFHPEPRLPVGHRAELSDYAHQSLYDRGHATPVGDFTVQAERDDTFTLGNMMPQTKVLNEQTWNNIENGVRDAAKGNGEVWIVTGPHVPAAGPLLHGDVYIPDATWKAIFIPKVGVLGAYWAPNDKSRTFETITIAELIGRTGVDPFPALSDAQKETISPLPAPHAGGN